MNPNKNTFIENPVKLDISRSKFNLSKRHSTTFTTGEVVPIYCNTLIQPGDTIKVNVDAVIKTTTPMCPVMDDLFLDIFWYFVPHKLVLSRESMSSATGATAAQHSFAAIMGAQDSLLGAPVPEQGSNIHLPMCDITATNANYLVNGLCDHLNIPPAQPVVVGTPAAGVYQVNCLPFLAYFSIWNNYFRDPNTQTPIVFDVGSYASGDVSFKGGPLNWTNQSAVYRMPCLFACRQHGYFGSALPWPQRNINSITMPALGIAPMTLGAEYDFDGSDGAIFRYSNMSSFAQNLYISSSGHTMAEALSSAPYGNDIDKSQLYADLRSMAQPTINQVRLLFQQQKWYEELARSGNRLDEMTLGLFGVRPHDAGEYKPEYLGGKRILIDNHIVANTAGTNKTTTEQQSIGSTGAFSLASDRDYYFTKSFDTWGTLMAVAVVRPAESFAQGIDRQFTKKTREDFYWPTFANIGEQPIYKKELYVSGNAALSKDDEVFGYQEAWAEYRFAHDDITGLLRPTENQAYWTYVNNFSAAPTLLGYLYGDNLYQNVDRTLQVAKSTAGFQIMGQFKHNIEAVRPMPTYSIPGLIDHN